MILRCNRYRVTRATKRKFSPHNLQQPGTYIQEAHSSRSIKNSSRSSKKKRTECGEDLIIINNDKKRIKTSTIRPTIKTDCCNFCLQIICSKAHNDKWFIRSSNSTMNIHSGHLPISNHHIDTSTTNLSPEVNEYLTELTKENIPALSVSKLISQKYNINITPSAIRQYHRKLLNPILKDAVSQPFGTPVERLIYDFKNRDDISFIYVTHSINSGFVTHYKDGLKSNEKNSQKYISVYHDEITEWRRLLQLHDETQLLVSFAWCHDDQLRLVRMYPEFIACDTTFGVTKEQRNLFLFAGIDGNNNTFSAMQCFMPSKEIRAYDWALRAALPYLVTTQTLLYNSCISTDQDLAMYQSI